MKRGDQRKTNDKRNAAERYGAMHIVVGDDERRREGTKRAGQHLGAAAQHGRAA